MHRRQTARGALEDGARLIATSETVEIVAAANGGAGTLLVILGDVLEIG